MTPRNTIFAALALALAAVSCKKDLEPQESSVPLTATANPAQPTVQAQPAAQPQQMQVSQPQPMQGQPQQVQKVAPGMNPPHGQPGHRCDIAVGTPLSQPVKTATPAAATAKPGATVTQVQPVATKTAPGMNPPHGQPGHRCDIAVGTPLSQPVKTTSTQTVNASTTNNGEPVTITPATISADGTVTPGTGVKVTKTNAPAILQDNSKPAEQK